MTDHNLPGLEEGRALWRRLPRAVGSRTGAEAVDPLELAAWLEGRLDEAAAARIEAALADDPGLLDLAVAARAALDDPAPAPDRLLVRARASFAPTVSLAGQARQGGGLRAWWRRMEWAAIGASFLIAAAGGFALGDGIGSNVQASSEFELADSSSLLDRPSGLFLGLEEQ